MKYECKSRHVTVTVECDDPATMKDFHKRMEENATRELEWLKEQLRTELFTEHPPERKETS